MYNIWTTDCCVYATTASGLTVYDVSTEALIDFVPMSITAVWADDMYIYAGTTESGVLRSLASGTVNFSTYKEYPDITANNIVYLHGAGSYLCVTTESGVDRYNVDTNAHEYTFVDNLAKCFQTTAGDYYYIINPEESVCGLDNNVFNWTYIREINVSNFTASSDCQIRVDIPVGHPYDIYTYAMSNGEDVRFLDSKLDLVPHYREVWDYVSDPVFWVKVPPETTKIYLLYGNPFVRDFSSASGTFDFYDDFIGNDIGPWWTYSDGGSSNNTYTVEDGLLKLDSGTPTSYGNGVTTNISFSGPKIVEYKGYMEYAYGDNKRDLDFKAGFTDGAYMYVGASDYTNEYPHTLHSNSDWGDIVGTVYMPLTLTDFSLVHSENFQSSTADGETLVSSGTQTMVDSTFYFTINNYWYEPDILIDCIRIRGYYSEDVNITFEMPELVMSKLSNLELHAVYHTGGGYIYKPDNIIEADVINDIFVTENTSSNGGNVLFLATSAGAMVIEEKRGDEINSDKLIYLLDA